MRAAPSFISRHAGCTFIHWRSCGLHLHSSVVNAITSSQTFILSGNFVDGKYACSILSSVASLPHSYILRQFPATFYLRRRLPGRISSYSSEIKLTSSGLHTSGNFVGGSYARSSFHRWLHCHILTSPRFPVVFFHRRRSSDLRRSSAAFRRLPSFIGSFWAALSYFLRTFTFHSSRTFNRALRRRLFARSRLHRWLSAAHSRSPTIGHHFINYGHHLINYGHHFINYGHFLLSDFIILDGERIRLQGRRGHDSFGVVGVLRRHLAASTPPTPFPLLSSDIAMQANIHSARTFTILTTKTK